ncbi:UTRA domain-containing protein, partial [Streptomyces sp. 2MCAF27]
GAVALLAELGYVGRRVREDVTARMPDEQERELLRTAELEPVMCLERVILDGDDRPIQADLITMPAHRQRLRYELRMG